MTRTGGRVLALDLGTSSARALVMDRADAGPDGRVPLEAAIARHRVEPHYAADGSAILDLDGYLRGLGHCLDSLQNNGDLAGVDDVVISSQWHSIVALDRSGHPLTPLIPWTDTRSVPARTPATFDDHAFHARTGAWLHRLYWTRRIPWLRDLLDDRADRFVGLPELAVQMLTGDPVSSASVMSGTGTLDLATRRYDDEALEIAGVRAERLPPIVTADWRGTFSHSAARRWPDLAGAAVHPATGDGAASNVGSGAYAATTAAVTVGTSAAVRVVHPIADAPTLPWELWRYLVDDTTAVTGMAFSAGGNLYAWLTELFGPGPGADALDPTGRAPGQTSVIAIPFQTGTRPPNNVPGGSGAMFGLSFDTQAADVVAATMEGCCLEIARGLEHLERLFPGPLDIVIGGGGVHASSWLRRCLTATVGRPAQVCSEPEVGCRGAAAVALDSRPGPGGETVRPDPADIERMGRRKTRYERLRSLAVAAAEPGR